MLRKMNNVQFRWNENEDVKFRMQKNEQQWINSLWKISWFIVFFNFFMKRSLWFSKIIIIKFKYFRHYWFQLTQILIQNFIHWTQFSWESVRKILIIQIIIFNIFLITEFWFVSAEKFLLSKIDCLCLKLNLIIMTFSIDVIIRQASHIDMKK